MSAFSCLHSTCLLCASVFTLLHLSLSCSIAFLSTSGPLTCSPNIPGGAQSSGMAEGGVGTCPQVFVVDSQANYVSMPSGKKSKWARLNQKFLLLLVGITMLGLVGEAYFIHNLYKKMEVRQMFEWASHSVTVRLCFSLSGRSVSTRSTWKFLRFRISLHFSTSPQNMSRQPTDTWMWVFFLC